MSKQEFYAREHALLIEINEQQERCAKAQGEIYDANVQITLINKARLALRQKYLNSKFGGQNHD